MAKQKKTKQAGYVPFTRDDINQEDGRNTRAEELFLQMLDIPKRVVKKKKKGRETEIVDDDFYPTSMDELQRMEGKMVQVEAAIDDCSDREFMDNVAYMKDVLAWSGKRQWNFAWWIVVCVAVMAIYYFVQAGNRAEDRDAVKNRSEEVVKAKYDEYVNVGMNNVTYWEGQVAAAPDEATKKSASETLEHAREEYAARLEQSAESYQEDTLKGYNRRVRSSYISALWCLIWIALYVIAERPYGYMLSKRRTEMKVYRGMRGALFGIAGAFVGAAAALQVTEYVTTYSDGSKERSNDAMPILLMKLGLIAVAVLLVLLVARIVIVIATIMGFIRNYDLISMSKQAFGKGKELTAKK